MKKLLILLCMIFMISCKDKPKKANTSVQQEVKQEAKVQVAKPEEFIKTAAYTDKETGENIVKILVPDNADEKTIENAMIKTLKDINREKKFSNYTIRVFGDERFWTSWMHSDTHGYMVVENYEVRKNIPKPKESIPTQEEKDLFMEYDTLVDSLSDVYDTSEALKNASTMLSNNKNIPVEKLNGVVEKVFEQYIDIK